MKFHNKQLEVLRCIKNEKPKILICSGAKRAGKTFVLTFAFMAHVAKYENKGLSFILGGATQASIRRNILDDMEGVLGREIKLNKSNAFDLFGNKVYCFDGANSDSYKKARGFTAAGAFLNEATTLHDTFVKEGTMTDDLRQTLVSRGANIQQFLSQPIGSVSQPEGVNRPIQNLHQNPLRNRGIGLKS